MARQEKAERAMDLWRALIHEAGHKVVADLERIPVAAILMKEVSEAEDFMFSGGLRMSVRESVRSALRLLSSKGYRRQFTMVVAAGWVAEEIILGSYAGTPMTLSADLHLADFWKLDFQRAVKEVRPVVENHRTEIRSLAKKWIEMIGDSKEICISLG